eukprot:7341911-Alexandrium_andersonii.AAC.1
MTPCCNARRRKTRSEAPPVPGPVEWGPPTFSDSVPRRAARAVWPVGRAGTATPSGWILGLASSL